MLREYRSQLDEELLGLEQRMQREGAQGGIRMTYGGSMPGDGVGGVDGVGPARDFDNGMVTTGNDTGISFIEDGKRVTLVAGTRYEVERRAWEDSQGNKILELHITDGEFDQ